MARFFKKRGKSRNARPGSFIHIGEQIQGKVEIQLIEYSHSNYSVYNYPNLSELPEKIDNKSIHWLNINGLHDIDLMKDFAKRFEMHHLLMEDILNTGHRSKFEIYDDQLIFILKLLRLDREMGRISAEQISFLIGDGYLVTFQERRGDVFDPVRTRIEKNVANIREAGSDFLAYSLLDIIVDNYIHILENFGEQIEEIDDGIILDPGRELVETINHLKVEMNFMKKTVRPVKEAVGQLRTAGHELIREETEPFLNDLQDHIIAVTETVDTYRELLTDQLNIYNSNISFKINEIMKILTIFSALFIPLTFIAGIYGTNFEYLPELHYRYSYFIFWGVMLTIAIGMLGYFRRKKWI